MMSQMHALKSQSLRKVTFILGITGCLVYLLSFYLATLPLHISAWNHGGSNSFYLTVMLITGAMLVAMMLIAGHNRRSKRLTIVILFQLIIMVTNLSRSRSCLAHTAEVNSALISPDVWLAIPALTCIELDYRSYMVDNVYGYETGLLFAFLFLLILICRRLRKQQPGLRNSPDKG